MADRTPEAMLKKLTPAQRAALCRLPVKRDFIPKYTGLQWPTLAILKSHRLINGVRDGMAGMGKDAAHRVTPSGIAVRALLEAGRTDG